MDFSPTPSAASRVFAIPELMDRMLTYLLCTIRPISPQEDPRSIAVNHNASILLHLRRCTEVNRTWHANISSSPLLQQALFLRAAPPDMRSWMLPLLKLEGSYSMMKYLREIRAPILNPVVQTTFSGYHFRFWHLNPEVNGNKYCAYLILTREQVELANLAVRAETGQGLTFTRMLLSQPPLTALEASIWEERDETKEYLGRTKALKESVIHCPEGVTVGLVHERVAGWMKECPDVSAIKLTTI